MEWCRSSLALRLQAQGLRPFGHERKGVDCCGGAGKGTQCEKIKESLMCLVACRHGLSF